MKVEWIATIGAILFVCFMGLWAKHNDDTRFICVKGELHRAKSAGVYMRLDKKCVSIFREEK